MRLPSGLKVAEKTPPAPARKPRRQSKPETDLARTAEEVDGASDFKSSSVPLDANRRAASGLRSASCAVASSPSRFACWCCNAEVSVLYNHQSAPPAKNIIAAIATSAHRARFCARDVSFN